MTHKFTTPCFIRRNTVGLRKKLEELGYISDKNNLLNISDFPCLYTYWHPNLGGIYNGIPCYIVNNCIDCGTNENLFLTLVELKKDTYEGQWFVMDAEVYADIPKGTWFKATNRNGGRHIGTQIDPLYCHKATVEEIINHFKNN